MTKEVKNLRDKVREFRGLIYQMYDSEADFARKIGLPRQKINKITNGIREPNIDELNIFAQALQRPVGEIAEIFLRFKSPNRQQISTEFNSQNNNETPAS